MQESSDFEFSLLLLPYPERRVIAYRVDNFQIDAGKMADLVERLVVGNAQDTSARLCGIRQFFGRENSPHMIGAVILQAVFSPARGLIQHDGLIIGYQLFQCAL